MCKGKTGVGKTKNSDLAVHWGKLYALNPPSPRWIGDQRKITQVDSNAQLQTICTNENEDLRKSEESRDLGS